MKPPLCVLTIAGSDSGAGAGVQADARTIHALGAYALTAITAITAQNTQGVQQWSPVASDLLAAQLRSVFDDFPVAAIKTGLLPGAAAVRVVSAALPPRLRVPVVIDPVIGSTTGTRFLSEAGMPSLKRRLLPRATLVTPNWPEAAALSGCPVRTWSDAEQAGRELAALYGCSVLVKGGHGPGPICRDCLVLNEGEVHWFANRRVKTRNTHGTGCVLSAAIAVELGRGRSLHAAVETARGFLQRALQAGRVVPWGRGGGPAFPGT
jgi:hydroxymethylpyrimidine kinase/phosphomethylpyrimidine kinase